MEEKRESPVSEVIPFNSIISEAGELQASRTDFMEYCAQIMQIIKSPNQENFAKTLHRMCSKFLNEVRPKTWNIEKQDVLCELEQCLHHLYIKMSRRPVNPLHNQNKALLMVHLTRLCKGKVPVFVSGTQSLSIQFFIGGAKHMVNPVRIDLGINHVTPEEYTGLSVLIAGINKTIIRTESPAYDREVEKLVNYILWLKQYPCITVNKQARLKLDICSFFQQEVDRMPCENRTLDHPEFSVYQEQTGRKQKAWSTFNAALEKVGLPHPHGYTGLKINVQLSAVNHALRPAPKHPSCPGTVGRNMQLHFTPSAAINLRAHPANNFPASTYTGIPGNSSSAIFPKNERPDVYSRDLHKLSTLLNTTIEHLRQNDPVAICNLAYAKFQLDFIRMLNTHEQKKWNIITSAKNIIAYQRKKANSNEISLPEHLDRLDYYLNMVLHRVNEPIKEPIKTELQNLINRYQRTRESKKQALLERLRLEIKNNPDKTYTECFNNIRFHTTRENRNLFCTSRLLWSAVEPDDLMQFINNTLLPAEPAAYDIWFKKPSRCGCVMM